MKSKWGGLGVRSALEVLAGAEKEEEVKDHEAGDGFLGAEFATVDIV